MNDELIDFDIPIGYDEYDAKYCKDCQKNQQFFLYLIIL
jgi:hypothetical protein